MSATEESPEKDEAVDLDALVTETLLGDLVAFLLDEIRAAPDVWEKLDQQQQEDVIHRCQLRGSRLIGAIVRLVAAEGRDAISADLEQITAKDEIKAVCKLGRHDSKRHALLDAVGKRVLLVVADAEQYLGGELPQAQPDQPDLPIADAGEGPGADPEPDPTTVH